jgi:hypothetical protein
MDQLDLGDRMLKNFKYDEALAYYKKSLECFETLPNLDSEMISDFLFSIQNKIQVVERIIKSTNKRTLRSEYTLDQLKKYGEDDWMNMSLYDILNISNGYNIPISEEENNMNDMKYKFYHEFTKKYNPELINLQKAELIVLILINEGKYDEVLNFLNISPNINKMIEDEVFNKNKVSSILLKRVKKFTDHLSDDVIFSINYCSWILKLTAKQKQQIKQDLLQLFTKELEKLEFVLYKNSYYKSTNDDNVPLKLEDIKKIIRSLNVYLRQVIEGGKNISGIKNDAKCIYDLLAPQRKTNNFFNRTLENIDRMLNNNQNYISLLL